MCYQDFIIQSQLGVSFVFKILMSFRHKLIFKIDLYSPDRGCTSKQGWQPHGNYIDSGNNQADNVYMTLRLPVKGFGSPEGLKKPTPGQYGAVEFVFEMICEGECTFKFKEVMTESIALVKLLNLMQTSF